MFIVIDDWAGQIVGVVFFNETPSPQSESVLNLMYTSRPSPRMLAETEGSRNATLAAAEVLLVRRTLAWLTGIILIIATLFGVRLYVNKDLETVLHLKNKNFMLVPGRCSNIYIFNLIAFLNSIYKYSYRIEYCQI